MAQYRTFIDSFTSLDDIKRKDEGNSRLVLATIIASGGSYSVFDATRTQRMARTIDYIERQSGWVRRKPNCQFPWIDVELTDKGIEAMAGLA